MHKQVCGALVLVLAGWGVGCEPGASGEDAGHPSQSPGAAVGGWVGRDDPTVPRVWVRTGLLAGSLGEIRDFNGAATSVSAVDLGWATEVRMAVDVHRGTAVVILTLGGGWSQPGLQAGRSVKISSADHRLGERLFVKVLGCSGGRMGNWTFQQLADEVEILVRPTHEPTVRLVEFVAHWIDNTLASESHGRTTVVRGSFHVDITSGGQGNWGELVLHGGVMDGELGPVDVHGGVAVSGYGDGHFARVELAGQVDGRVARITLVFDRGVGREGLPVEGIVRSPLDGGYIGYVPVVLALGTVTRPNDAPEWERTADEVELEEAPSPDGLHRVFTATVRWHDRAPDSRLKLSTCKTVVVRFAVIPPG